VYVFENVELIMNLAAADHVKDLHKHEDVKDEGVVAGRTGFFSVLLI
jgi:hypothetical protein